MTTVQPNPPPRSPLADSRALSAVEFLVGAALVIGHNVYKVVPNEVIILFIVGLVSARVRNGSFAALGFRRPDSWTRIVLIALAAAVLRIVLGDFVLLPITERFWPAPETSAVIEDVEGNLGYAALTLLLVWTFAAFGEEIAYRGYLFTRLTEALTGGNRENGYREGRAPARPHPPSLTISIIAVIVTSILFGYGHYYKGPAGIVDSAFAGLVLAGAYLASGRILWTSILAHGFIDTIAVVLTYLGWAD